MRLIRFFSLVSVIATLPAFPAGNTVRIPAVPLRFEPEGGRYVARGSRYSVALRSSEALMRLRREARSSARLRMTLVGARSGVRGEGLERQPGPSHYLIGNDAKRWRIGVPAYSRVRFAGVYRGVSVSYYGSGHELEFDFEVEPGAAASQIRLAFEGAGRIEVDRAGDLVLDTEGGQVRQRRPVAWQPDGLGGRRPVEARWRLRGRAATFELGAYDSGLPLVIDPVVRFATFLGGALDDTGEKIAVDARGNIYVTGSTESSAFPVRNAYQSTMNGPGDIFVAKIAAGGAGLEFVTYLGGSGFDNGRGIAVDAQSNIWVTGNTFSTNFPLQNAFQSTNRSGFVFGTKGANAIVTKLNAGGTALLYSTYLGGSGTFDQGNTIAVDREGNAVVAGRADESNFPTTQNAIQRTFRGGIDTWVAKFAPNGTLLYSTFLGGGDQDLPRGIGVDAAGNAYVAGETRSTNFPVSGAVQSAKGDSGNVFDAYVTKINAAGSAIVYSTYLGGRSDDGGRGIAVTPGGEVFVTGVTRSSNFPLRNPYQSMLGNREATDEDIFVTKLDAGGALAWSTFFGADRQDIGLGIAADAQGSAYVAGWTNSTSYPVREAFQPSRGSAQDAIVAKFDAQGQLAWSSFLGGSGGEIALNIAVDESANVYVCGYTRSADFPVVQPVQRNYGGAGTTAFATGDAFIAILSDSGALAPRVTAVSAASFLGPNLALESIASAYGNGIADRIEVAPPGPLPTSLAGVSARLTDSAGADHALELFFVAQGQLNFLVPKDAALGPASLTVTRADGSTMTGSVVLEAVAPALFSANSSGRGVAAALALRVAADGSQTTQPIFSCTAAGCTATAINLGPESEQVFLLLFGTGIRGYRSSVTAAIGGEPAEVLGALAQGEYAGLDQVNVRLSRRLAGRGDVNIELAVDGRAANVVTVRVGVAE
jgi:uncharacterized protein (TIGR03437 family)